MGVSLEEKCKKRTENLVSGKKNFNERKVSRVWYSNRESFFVWS